ncbi:hypothetical protein [Pedobacter gandavensis]|uniref:hypothetical protein n=1 Tax=Pedobacter gandavensis TaxID=2679963 RepID=UPI00292CCA31|nr:hypothetical protein [Pedobacter gandavensis]
MNQTDFDFSHKYDQFITELNAAMNYRDSRGYLILNPESKLENAFNELYVHYCDQILAPNHQGALDDAALAYYYFCTSTGRHDQLNILVQKLGTKMIKKFEKSAYSN